MTRAMARLSTRMRAGLVEPAVRALKRSSNSSFFMLPSSNASSVSVLLLTSSIFTAPLRSSRPCSSSRGGKAPDHLDLDRDLVSRPLEGQLGPVLADAADLEQHRPRLHAGGPVLDVALAAAHAGLGGLAGHRLVRE